MNILQVFTNELSFFYNPVEIESIFSGNVFPAVGLFADAGRFVKHLSLEFTGFDLSDPTKSREEVQKKALPIKYLGKMLPVTKSLITYGAIISEDFAKEYDVTIQKDNNK